MLSSLGKSNKLADADMVIRVDGNMFLHPRFGQALLCPPQDLQKFA
jgi:hypothetical protein